MASAVPSNCAQWSPNIIGSEAAATLQRLIDHAPIIPAIERKDGRYPYRYRFVDLLNDYRKRAGVMCQLRRKCIGKEPMTGRPVRSFQEHA